MKRGGFLAAIGGALAALHLRLAKPVAPVAPISNVVFEGTAMPAGPLFVTRPTILTMESLQNAYVSMQTRLDVHGNSVYLG